MLDGAALEVAHQIRTEALLLAHHREVLDATQQHVVEEFIRYMNHAGSGMAGLTDMGQNWARVRDGVKAKTARSSDKPVTDVSARFDQLIQHVGLQLSSMLGVSVQPVAPRNAPDNASRCQQLADRVGASITVQAPRGYTRPATRVAWLLRRFPDAAHDMIRVEALLGGRRGASIVELLGKLRRDPAKLLPADQSDWRGPLNPGCSRPAGLPVQGLTA